MLRTCVFGFTRHSAMTQGGMVAVAAGGTQCLASGRHGGGRVEAARVVQALPSEENEAFHCYGAQQFRRRSYFSLKHAFG